MGDGSLRSRPRRPPIGVRDRHEDDGGLQPVLVGQGGIEHLGSGIPNELGQLGRAAPVLQSYCWRPGGLATVTGGDTFRPRASVLTPAGHRELMFDTMFPPCGLPQFPRPPTTPLRY